MLLWSVVAEAQCSFPTWLLKETGICWLSPISPKQSSRDSQLTYFFSFSGDQSIKLYCKNLIKSHIHVYAQVRTNMLKGFEDRQTNISTLSNLKENLCPLKIACISHSNTHGLHCGKSWAGTLNCSGVRHWSQDCPSGCKTQRPTCKTGCGSQLFSAVGICTVIPA